MRPKIELSKKIFFALILLLPLNLGKHFVMKNSFVSGILSDYLVPTIYIQDLLIALILIFWLLEKGIPSKQDLLNFFNKRSVQLIILFIFSIAFSVLVSDRIVPSASILLRVALYAILSFYISSEMSVEKDFPVVVRRLSWIIIFLSVLSVAQFIKQGSVFNNYLVLGEQPYAASTWGIARESVFGKTIVPSYGLFRHPNIFGGFLSIVLIWIFFTIQTESKNKLLLTVSFMLGLLSLFLTFSYVAWAGFITGFVSYLFIKKGVKERLLENKKKITILFISMALIINILTPLFINFRQPSWYRRGSLIFSSLEVIKKYPLFGVGPGNFIEGINDIRFIQPVHNIFFLVFSESGVFVFTFLLLILGLAIKKLLTHGYFFLFLISILQIIFEGSLDHYFWTIHQTLLLMWVVLGFIFAEKYPKKPAEI